MSRRRLRVAGLLAAGAPAAIVAALLVGGGSDYIVRAQFDDAAGLRKGFLVKIAGAPVGEVERVDLGRGDRAVAVVRLDRKAAPVGRDATAAIRPSNLLGEKYVDLDPGDVRRPAPSGAVIPPARTATPSELDDLLDVFDADTRVALGVFLSEQGKMLVGRGGDLAAALVRLPPALDQGRRLVAGLARNNGALGRLIDDSDRILAPVARERRSLGRLVDSAGGALDTLAARRRDLGDTVRRAPAAMAQVRRSLIELERAAVPLRPAARGLRASAPALTAMLRELPGFTEAARPTLRTARAVAPALDRLGRGSTPFLRRLRPAASELATFARALDPVSALFDDGIADVLGVVEGWARAIQNRDAAGHVYRIGLEFGGDLVTRLRRGFIDDHPLTRSRHAKKPPAAQNHAPGAHTPEQKLPPLPRRPELPGLPKPSLPKPEVPPLPDLAGLPARDDAPSRLLDYLLGP